MSFRTGLCATGARRPARVLAGVLAAGSLAAIAAGPAGIASGSTKAGPPAGSITVFSQGDVNVENLWQKVLIPRYEKKFPEDRINLVFTTNSAENTDVYDELAASAKAGKSSSFDLLDGAVPAEAAPAGLLTPITTSEIPAASEVDPSAFKVVDGDAIPLRGSEVLLAYNSQAVKNPPKTLNDLISWIHAHPGEFSYCNPSDGGSGAAFVEAVLSKYTPAAENLKMQLGYSPSAEKYWAKGLQVLKSLTPDVFQQQYPNSNTGVITLLASGAIEMGTVWSDQGTTALDDGELPSVIKLTEITPPLEGGPDYLGVPKNIPQAKKELAYQFINWALQPDQQVAIVRAMHGTPAIEFKYLPAKTAQLFADYSTSPELPYSANTGADMNSKWTSVVG